MSEYLTKEALERLGDFKIGGHIICTVKYADNLVLLAKEEKVLWSLNDRLIETGRCYEMEMNVEKTKVMRSSRQPSNHYVGSKTTENVEYFNYLGSMVTSDTKCTREIKSKIATAKAAFNKQTLFISKMDLNLRKKVQCYILCIALYGVETWPLLKVDHKYLGSFESGAGKDGDWLDQLCEK